MSIYEAEYRKYYSKLKGSSPIRKEIKDTGVVDYLPTRYSSNIYGSKTNKKSKGSSIGSMFIFDLVGALLLILFVTISRTSTNVEVKEYYNLFESSVTKEGFEEDKIIESINRYLDFNQSSIIQEENL